MEATGIVFGQPLRFPFAAGAGVRPDSRELGSSSSLNFAIGSSGFRDRGHVRYYNPVVAHNSSTVTPSSSKAMNEVKAAKKMKKKQLKLLKGLFRDLTRFSQMGLGLRSDQEKENMISEASELLLKQLEKVKAEEKQLKRKMKQEKARLKASQIGSSPLESTSSDSECGEVVEMSDLTRQAIDEATTLAYPVPITPTEERPSSCNDAEDETSKKAFLKKIEVCMGGKCKKSGAGALLEEFQRAIGVDGAVTGCKCMGKCRDGPNVKVLDVVDGSLVDKSGSKSLCIGVGLEDVDMIVGSFLGSNVGLVGSC